MPGQLAATVSGSMGVRVVAVGSVSASGFWSGAGGLGAGSVQPSLGAGAARGGLRVRGRRAVSACAGGAGGGPGFWSLWLLWPVGVETCAAGMARGALGTRKPGRAGTTIWSNGQVQRTTEATAAKCKAAATMVNRCQTSW